MKTRHSLPLGLVALLTTSTVIGANWPSWRGGVDGSGVSSEKNLPIEWSDFRNVRWKVPLPERGNSTPVVWGNRIFITQAVESEGRRTLMCLDRANGRLLWQSGTTWKEKEETHETNPYCSASPATDGERVIAAFGSAGVFCYGFDGKELWSRDLGKQAHEWGYASSPVIHGDLCFVYHGPGPGSHLIALDKKNGRTIWRFDEPPAKTEGRGDGFKGKEPGYVGTWSTPILIQAGGRDELVMSFPNRVVAFDPQTGKQLWTCDGLNPLLYASPVYGEGLVVAMGGFFGSAIAVKPGGSGDVTGTQRVWREERAKKNRCGSGVVADGRIYFVNMEGFIECIDMKTGQQLWEERLPRQGSKGESWSNTLLVGDRIYAMNQSGDVVVFKAGPKFEVVAVNSIGNETTNASLIPSNGEFLLRTHKHLWCIGESKAAASTK
jgi:outer membrane protein assembly factor BamB